MTVVDRNMQEQIKVIFNENFKTLSSLIKSASVGVLTLYILSLISNFIQVIELMNSVSKYHTNQLHQKHLILYSAVRVQHTGGQAVDRDLPGRSKAAALWSLSKFICCLSMINTSSFDSIQHFFGSTYRAEIAFSQINLITSASRKLVTDEHLNYCLHLCQSNYETSFSKISAIDST